MSAQSVSQFDDGTVLGIDAISQTIAGKLPFYACLQGGGWQEGGGVSGGDEPLKTPNGAHRQRPSPTNTVEGGKRL